MLGGIVRFAVQIGESALAAVGVRAGTEEPAYTSEPLADGVEIRRYGPRIAAQTTVAAATETARSEGFRRLAGYIFGRNHTAQRIAMTAPVAQSADRRGQRIAMTAPVAQTGADDGSTIRFFMPAKWTMQDLPTPDDDRVTLVEVPAETLAVLRFTGDRGADSVAARTRQLTDTLRATGFAPTGAPTAWFYDPPWTLPFLRRNEVAVPIDA
ncbi:heme-binding protein [Mycobacterium sp. PS03-16]|uniref:SOUL family heme-binding protein n=1 Tax=Mycobacterium sp. PS03-16 TaxID=2559611 RepID=UPI001074365D|nr:heme-binding protein [Mycobacterium sp. PS03-16]TFV55151.1 heme-binding protein [Mycobacterium sp. PS03-16]